MTQYKEFHAKSLDDAIREACDYFGVAREKLEIEIVSDAKSGIFGLVGAKKATIRAAKRPPSPTFEENAATPVTEAEDASGKRSRAPSAKPPAARGAKADTARDNAAGKDAESRASRKSGKSPAKQENTPAAPSDAESGRQADAPISPPSKEGMRKSAPRGSKAATGTKKSVEPETPKKTQPRGRKSPDPAARKEAGQSPDDHGPVSEVAHIEQQHDDLPEFDLASRGADDIKSIVANVVSRLVSPIVGDVPCEVSIGKDRIRASLDCGDAVGLLVGREGQTLASVQYLAARILSRELGGSVRLYVDAGNYREKQEDRIKELALSLAERVKKTRRPQTTRPLSAYQRRIIHLALESDAQVTTQSKGEGAQRRVVIFLARQRCANASERDAEEPLSPDPADEGGSSV